MAKKVIGIDLGTTNSCVAVMEGNEPTVIVNSEGKRTTPSIVAFVNNEKKVGDVAKRQAVTNPKNTIYSIKRFMGKNYSEVSEEIKHFPYTIERSDNNGCVVNINGKKITPQEISATILQKMKKTAEDFLGQTVSDAVITVPAYFNDIERQSVRDAGKIAGLNVLRIINEPTAAAIAYGMDKKKDENIKIAVFDLGGGTFDISILEIGGGVFEVKATNGDKHLGGDNFDEKIIQWLTTEFKNETGINLNNDVQALQRLKDAAEKAKIELSSSTSTEINIPFITADSTGPKHLNKTLTRANFENLCSDLIERCKIPCEKCVNDSGFSISEIDEVILVGGSTRIPAIQELVKNYFGKTPNKGVNPDEVVAVGAAIQGAVLTGEIKDVVLLDVTPISLGIETLGGVCTKIVEANTTVPTKKTEVFSTATDNQTSVSIHILQGERPMAKDNRSLGMFNLEGIPAAPRGVPQIEVTFDIDANGILNVSAKEKTTGKEQKIRIENSSNLSKEEIERMRKEAEENAEHDQKEREVADKINEADNIIFQTEKQLKEYGDKLPEDIKSRIENDLSELKKAKDSRDINEINASRDKLTESLQSIYQHMQNSQNNQQQNTSEEDKKDENIQEAKYEEVK